LNPQDEEHANIMANLPVGTYTRVQISKNVFDMYVNINGHVNYIQAANEEELERAEKIFFNEGLTSIEPNFSATIFTK
jgi:hypothetical protein